MGSFRGTGRGGTVRWEGNPCSAAAGGFIPGG